MLKPSFFSDRVLDELGINSPADLLRLQDIAWERGALVRFSLLEGAEARLTVLGHQAVITVSTAIASVQRRRFSIAHELGHLEMQHSAHTVRSCSSADIGSWGARSKKPSLEQVANQFASALLLPERFIAHQCTEQEPCLDHIAQLAAEFDVSLTATSIRYVTFCEEPIAVVFSQNGHIKWFHANRCFEDLQVFIPIGDCLHSLSLADRVFEGRSSVRRPKRVPASAWFGPGKYRPDADILEQSWAMPRHSSVLTLLWVDDDIEDDSLPPWLLD